METSALKEGLGGRRELFKESQRSRFILMVSLCLFPTSVLELELLSLSLGLPQ